MKFGLYPKAVGKNEERGEGRGTDEASTAAQNENSIGSNDSQRTIIRKDYSQGRCLANGLQLSAAVGIGSRSYTRKSIVPMEPRAGLRHNFRELLC